jgi:hypothetical protein
MNDNSIKLFTLISNFHEYFNIRIIRSLINDIILIK